MDVDDDFPSIRSRQKNCTTLKKRQKNCTILKEEDIRRRLEDDIAEVSNVLSVSTEDACILLHRYKWSLNSVCEEWFADEERVRKSFGLLEKPVVQFTKDSELVCGICFETFLFDSMKTVAACVHPFCSICWTGYISTSINDGPGCLMLTCPDPSCRVPIGRDMINTLTSDKDKDKYNCYLFRSYIEENIKTKWCPAPDCGCAVEYIFGSGNYDVCCLCQYSFCWNCGEEAHRPVDCDTVTKWTLKNNHESANTSWILVNSKPCPKCKKAIEKNQGCNHMTCRDPCRYQFCWICLGGWKNHHTCNIYGQGMDEAERMRSKAKKYLERYTHYYERWATNHSSREKAIADLNEMQTVHIEKLGEIQCEPISMLMFIIEAWQQIVECRRVLKWSYAYGYYLPKEAQTKRQFFEYLQGEAEIGLERLHQCAEIELKPYLVPEGSRTQFNNFRVKLDRLTSATRTYFENLVKALENDLSDVDSQPA